MNRYASITFSAIFLLIAFFSCQVWAASITETKASIGKGCDASGSYSTAMGYKTEASGIISTAMGYTTTASGTYSTAMGYYTTASAYYSTAMGIRTTASAESSTVIGKGLIFAPLDNDIPYSFMVGYMSDSSDTTPEFFVKDGAVGIGTKKPQNLLDLGDSQGKKLAVFQKTTGNDFYGFGIAPGTLEIYAGADVSDDPVMVVTKTTRSLGIGTSSPGQKLDIASGNGRVGTGYSWLTNSDQRLKKNISTLEGSLDKISRLRGVRFDSKEAVYADENSGKHIGVIAQELEKEYPELVVGDETTGYKAVAYDKLTAVLIEAVKEMKAQNEKQQAEIEELRSMIKELKS
jgi:hypothetical protein